MFAYLRQWVPEKHLAVAPYEWRANLSEHDARVEAVWATQAFFAVTQAKIVAVHRLLTHGFNVIFTDVDLVWVSERVVEWRE